MNLPVILSAEARADFDEAADWYGKESADLGDRFIDAVWDTLDRIRMAPEVYGAVWKDVRCALVRRFPYAVYYQVRPEGAVVIAVVHTKRDPAVWQRRV